MRIAIVALVSLPCTGVIAPGGPDSAPVGVPTAAPAPWSVCQSPDPASAVTAVQSGDELQVDIEYGGGCGDQHRFGICRDSLAFMESLPVQTNALIWHDSGGDKCEALLTTTVYLPLDELYEAFDEAYGAPGQVSVNLDAVSVTIDVPAP